MSSITVPGLPSNVNDYDAYSNTVELSAFTLEPTLQQREEYSQLLQMGWHVANRIHGWIRLHDENTSWLAKYGETMESLQAKPYCSKCGAKILWGNGCNNPNCP